jgi:integrase/recombinase XerD
MLAQRGNPTSGPLFLTERGRPLYNGWSFRLLKRLGRIASVPQAEQLSAHSMRGDRDHRTAPGGAAAGRAGLRPAKDPRTTRRYDRARGNLDRAGS